jgi:hypothetical protein
MWYWRDEDFSILAEASRIAAGNPAWVGYAKYCELLEGGLRKDALRHLSTFIESSSAWSFAEKKEFVSWLYHYAYPRRFLNQLLPQPLREKLLEPTLAEWMCREPENSEPHRWIGGIEHLEEAIRLNPADEIARYRLAEAVFGHVGYSIHELPYGYIGNPEEDLGLLREAEAAISGISDAEIRTEYRAEVAEMRKSIHAYLNGEAET